MLNYFHILILSLILTLCYAKTDEESNPYCDCSLDISIAKALMEDLKDVRLKLDNIIERQNHVNEHTKFPSTCTEATNTTRKRGIYSIEIGNYKEGPFLVSCVDATDDSLWMVMQRHVDANIDFHRNWTDYKNGFGDLKRSFWIGLDKLHAITTRCQHELMIVMKDYNDTTYFARYDEFAIGDESQDYALVLLGNYTGNAGDSLKQHIGCKFSTPDRDNDEDFNCAKSYTGGWWYTDCYYSHLNGNYSERNSGNGVTWNTIRRNVSLKSSEMLIHPKC